MNAHQCNRHCTTDHHFRVSTGDTGLEWWVAYFLTPEERERERVLTVAAQVLRQPDFDLLRAAVEGERP